MYKKTRVSIFLVGAIIGSSLSMNMLHAACPTSPNPCPSGTVWINLGDGIDQTITVSNGEYDIRVNGNMVHGTINMEGNYSIPSLGGTDGYGNITKFPGTTYQLKNTTEVLNVLNGYVSYNGQKIQISNGQFTLNNSIGTIDAAGKILYNGQALNLFDIPGVEGYQLNGQAFITNPNTGTIASNKDFKAWVNNLPADKGRGNMNFARGLAWQEFNNTTPNASQKQVTAWLKANPSLTPREVFNNMKNYKIHYYAIMAARQELGDAVPAYYSFNMGRFGNYNAEEVRSEVVTTKELYDAGLIAINPTGMGRGGFGSLDGIFNGDNVYEGAAAGWLNKGVMYADRYGIPPVSGKTDEQVSFSQKDLNEAKLYRSAGYWGPKDSGDMDIEFRKAGYVTGEGLNRKYTYGGNLWRNDKPTGPNIADPAVYKIILPVPNPAITSFTTSPASITSGQSSTLRWASTNADKCTLSGVDKATSGTMNVSPASTTTYNMVCTKGTINSTPKAATVTVNQIASCQNLYWFDTTTKSCGQKQFCGMYMYQGLQTFSTQAQCTAALPTVSTPEVTSFTASPASITAGQLSTLTWTSTKADNCVISYENMSNNADDISYPRARAGSFTISPTTTANFLIICSKGNMNSLVKRVTINVNNGVSTTNPYKSSLSTSVQTKLNAFISTRIIVRSTSLTPANYSKFLGGIITKLNTIKSNTPAINTTKLNTIGYLVYELQQIQDSIDDSDSFLDGLFN